MTNDEKIKMEAEISYLNKSIDRAWACIKADIARKEVLLCKLLHTKTDEITDGCEWNPKEDRPTLAQEGSHKKAQVILGRGEWRLCKECSNLPRFKNYKARKEIK